MANGNLSMKSNFKEMSFSELRAFIVAHRENDEAIHELFVNRRNPNTVKYCMPQTEGDLKQMEEVLKRKINDEF